MASSTLRVGRRACVKELTSWLGPQLVLVIALAGVFAAASIHGADNNAPALRPEHDNADCPHVTYVYPYWSFCYHPLRHFEAFHLTSGSLGGLEMDRTSSSGIFSNLVRFTGSSEQLGATFYAVPLELDPLLGVPVDKYVILVNTETLSALTWTFRAWFRGLVLTEEPLASTRAPARFRFLETNQPMACPLIANARCESYSLLSDSAPLGLTPFNFSAGFPTVLMPATDSSEDQSLIFLAIRPSSNGSVWPLSAAFM